jgi:thiamine pyrophosphate-dependent acetolactate synthase large subunit-like protein
MADRYGIYDSMKLYNPDFTKIARTFGIKAMQTNTMEGLEKIFRHYVNWDKPFLIEFQHPVSPPPWK